MSAKRKVKRSNSLESLRELYKLRSQENKQSKREKDGCKEDGSKNNTANVTLGIKELYGNKTMDPDGTNKDTSKKGESPSKAELTWGNIMKFQVKSLKRRHTIKRRATLADFRYIDVLKPIPESEEESDAESPFPLFRQSSKSTTTLTSPRFKNSKDSLEYEMRPRKTMEESSEKGNSVVEANASYQGLHHEESSMGTSDFSSFECNHIFDQYLETISDEDEMSSSYSDDNSETLELKKAVSNYELSYDVDDNENVNIMERLNKTIPDTASECDTDSLRSQSPTTAEDLYETLYTLGDTFTPRRRSYSLDAALSLPSISEERRRSSTFSTMSDASVF
ncbi:hypothetical protein QZH41_004500 [Actinostola sp. cb2023]|nr:hypothetical protein QZH41_004500 [Actinostola sp. cb2023]